MDGRISRGLRDNAFDVGVAARGERAMLQVDSNKDDLIILDLRVQVHSLLLQSANKAAVFNMPPLTVR